MSILGLDSWRQTYIDFALPNDLRMKIYDWCGQVCAGFSGMGTKKYDHKIKDFAFT